MTKFVTKETHLKKNCVEKLNKYNGLFMVVTMATLIMLFFIKRDPVRVDRSELNKLQLKLTILNRRNDSLTNVVEVKDSLIEHSIHAIQDLTKPKVTDETVKDAIEWIYEYNLQQP